MRWPGRGRGSTHRSRSGGARPPGGAADGLGRPTAPDERRPLARLAGAGSPGSTCPTGPTALADRPGPRALVSVPDTLGHLHPMIPLAVALRAAGYQVRVATGQAMAAHVRAAGLVDMPVGGRDGVSAGRVRCGPEWLADLMPGWLTDLRRHTAGWRPDVVVRPWMEGAGAVLAAELGAPQAVCGVCLCPPPEQLAGHPVVAALSRHGIAPDVLYGDVWISGYPPSFARPGTRPLPHEHHVRPPLYDYHPAHPIPDWVERLPDEQVVYATLGTAYNWVPGVFERLVEAFAGEPYHAVVTTGPDRDPATVAVGRLPDNVWLARYVPQSVLMPRCAAVVCHGGFTTVMSALSHGVPIGFVPLSGDHGTTAGRTVDLGAGTCYPRTLSTPFAYVPPDRLDPQSLRRMVRRLLDGSSARFRAERIKAEIAALPGVDHAVALIDRLVGRPAGGGPASDVR